MTVNNTASAGAAANNTNKKVIVKNCPRFTDCISKINNTQIDNAECIDIVMPMYSLIEHATNNNDPNIAGRVDFEIMFPLKDLSNFWRALEMCLINCEVEFILNWSASCVIIYTNVNNKSPTFTMTETNFMFL